MNKILKKKNLKIYAENCFRPGYYTLEMPNLDVPERQVYHLDNPVKMQHFTESDMHMFIKTGGIEVYDADGNHIDLHDDAEMYRFIAEHILEMEHAEAGHLGIDAETEEDNLNCPELFRRLFDFYRMRRILRGKYKKHYKTIDGR